MRPRSWFVPLLLLAVPVGAQLQPGLVRGPYLQAPSPTSIVLRWRTDLPADSRVRYGEVGSGLDREAKVAGLRTEHATAKRRWRGCAPSTPCG